MKMRLLNLYDAVLTSFWFIPGLMTGTMLILSIGLPIVDGRIADGVLDRWLWLDISPESAQTILSTIAGAAVSIMGVVFSLTVLTLSIASSQMGPRLLRTFMADRTTHFALGLYLSTAVYALIVLTVVEDTGDNGFVPRISVLFALFAAVVSLCYLVSFINRVAYMIQAPNIVEAVAAELDGAIDRLFPDPVEKGACLESKDEGERESREGAVVVATKEGYLQGVDTESLVQRGREDSCRYCVHCRPGQYVTLGDILVTVLDGGEMSDEFKTWVNGCFVVGPRRTPRQDLECAISELTEVAVRALSPGVNDPNTALNCIDRLGGSLSRLARRKMPGGQFHDDDGVVRVSMPPQTFASAVNEAFDQIRQYGRDSVAINVRLIEALDTISSRVVRREDGDALLAQAEMLVRGAEKSIPEDRDRADIVERFERMKAHLDG